MTPYELQSLVLIDTIHLDSSIFWGLDNFETSGNDWTANTTAQPSKISKAIIGSLIKAGHASVRVYIVNPDEA